jgi:hypothetical protein
MLVKVQIDLRRHGGKGLPASQALGKLTIEGSSQWASPGSPPVNSTSSRISHRHKYPELRSFPADNQA